MVNGSIECNYSLLPRLENNLFTLKIPEAAGSGNEILILIVQMAVFVIVLVNSITVVRSANGKAQPGQAHTLATIVGKNDILVAVEPS